MVVLSRRPGRVLADLPVELKRPRAASMAGEPGFVHAVDGIWQRVEHGFMKRTIPLPEIVDTSFPRGGRRRAARMSLGRRAPADLV